MANLVKRDAFDTYRFDRECDATSVPTSRMDVTADVFTTLFRDRWRYVKDADGEHKEFLRNLVKTENYQILRSSTVCKSGPAFVAAKSLVESYNPPPPKPNESKKDRAARVRRSIRRAAAMAAEAVENYELVQRVISATEDAHQGIGSGDGPSDPETLKMIQHLIKDKKLLSIINLAGKMQSLATHNIETKFERGDMKLVGVEMGDNLSKILPSELCALSMCPELFVYRMMEKQLIQYRGEGKRPQTGGPVIVCVDESSSMLTEDRIIYAKATLFGLHKMAVAQRREFGVIRFSSEVQYHLITSVVDLMKLLHKFLGGGTIFAGALQRAFKEIETSRRQGKVMGKADIIFLTDGDNTVPRPRMFREMAKRLNTKIISVLMDVRCNPSTVRSFSDEVIIIGSGDVEREVVANKLINSI